MSDFVQFARAHGLRLDYVVADGRWHRTPTEDKPKRRNGAYLFDGCRGVVKNFATMQDYAAYRDGAQAGKLDRSALRAQRVINEAAIRARQDEARRTAEYMVKRASFETHPYLASKGFPEERGLVLDGELLIPMREFSFYKRINSIQRIAADGTKLFLPSGKAKGSVFFLGPFMARERWLVEGYATALSVRAALRELRRDSQVVVCFSASNLAFIGGIVRALSPKAFVFADHDASKAGEKAAHDSGLPWTMAHEEGLDANDVHQRYGLRTLVNLIRNMSLEPAIA